MRKAVNPVLFHKWSNHIVLDPTQQHLHCNYKFKKMKCHICSGNPASLFKHRVMPVSFACSLMKVDTV